MAKIRLTRDHRDALERLANDLVDAPKERAAFDMAYAEASSLVRKMVKEALPPKDMNILAKYEKAGTYSYVQMTLTQGGFVEFRWNSDEANRPLMIINRTFLADQTTTDAYNAWSRTLKALKEALAHKKADYRALIEGSRYFDDVVEIWPEAERLRSKFGSVALTILSTEVIFRIRSDVNARKAA